MCVSAERAWPAWKCDLILINDNHMEHDWMIYGTTSGNNRRLQAGRRWKRGVLQIADSFYWWGDTHERAQAVNGGGENAAAWFSLRWTPRTKKNEKKILWCTNFSICVHRSILFFWNAVQSQLFVFFCWDHVLRETQAVMIICQYSRQ